MVGHACACDRSRRLVNDMLKRQNGVFVADLSEGCESFARLVFQDEDLLSRANKSGLREASSVLPTECKCSPTRSSAVILEVHGVLPGKTVIACGIF